MKKILKAALLVVFAFGNGWALPQQPSAGENSQSSGGSGQNTSPPQLQPRPAGPGNPSGETGRQITLDVQVTDHSGTAVHGLQQQDFTLLDDKAPQNILSLREINGTVATASDPVVEVILVVDAVNTGVRAVSYERDAIKQFLLRNGGQLPQPVSLGSVQDGLCSRGRVSGFPIRPRTSSSI